MSRMYKPIKEDKFFFQQDDPKMKKVIEVLKNVGASYPAEIAQKAFLTDYDVNDILMRLEETGRVEQVEVSFYRPDQRLIRRVGEMSAKGQGGYTNFSRKRWYAIVFGGDKDVL